jgi:hypothetical protein
MLLGQRGARALDQAVARLGADRELAGAEAFALALDPDSGKTGLFPLTPILAGTGGEAAARRLEDRFAFLGLDYDGLAALRRRGYGEIVLLTDRFGGRGSGFRAVELDDVATLSISDNSSMPSYAAWPTEAGYERGAGAYRIRFAERGRAGSLSLAVMLDSGGGFAPLERRDYRFEAGRAGFSLVLPGPGLYRVDIDDGGGAFYRSYGFRLAPARLAGAASGDFSRRMLAVFPLLEEAPRPAIAMCDAATDGAAKIAGRILTINTTLPAAGPPSMLPPWASGCRPILGGLEGDGSAIRLALGPEALANEDLALVYDGIILAVLPPPYATEPRVGGGRITVKSGIAFTRDEAGLLPLNPPPGEFLEGGHGESPALPEAPGRALPYAIALIALAAGKLLAFRHYSGKRLFRA